MENDVELLHDSMCLEMKIATTYVRFMRGVLFPCFRGIKERISYVLFFFNIICETFQMLSNIQSSKQSIRKNIKSLYSVKNCKKEKLDKCNIFYCMLQCHCNKFQTFPAFSPYQIPCCISGCSGTHS